MSESCSSQTSSCRATVAIYGESGSGRKTIISLLNKRPLTRAQDGKSFVFDAQLGSSASPDASIAVLLYNAVNKPSRFKSMVEQARERFAFVCVAHTKFDLVTGDYSDEHIARLHFAPWVEFTYEVDCIDVSLTTGYGVDDLLCKLMNYVYPSSAPQRVTFTQALMRIRDALLDQIAAVFTLPTRHWSMNAELPPELSEITTNTDLHQRVQSEMNITWGNRLQQRLHVPEGFGSVSIYRIAHALVAKIATPSERASLDYVRRHTSIPVPRTYIPDVSMLVMDFVDGDMLHECWDKLGVFGRFRVACTLRLYVNQMRALRRANVGAVDTGYVGGILFGEDLHGPFDTTERFRRFCQYVSCLGWRQRARQAQYRGSVPPPMPRPRLDWTPVFTHGDLNPSNVLIDREGTLWIVDWATAGFYPRCIESVAMWHVDVIVNPEDDALSWKGYRWFIAGATTDEEQQFWYSLFSAIHRFRGVPNI